MATAKQIAANRLNAKKSSGPRSADGKARSGRNATRHGLASDIRTDPSALRLIDALVEHLRSAGYAGPKSRLLAESQIKMQSILRMRSKFSEQLRALVEPGFANADFMKRIEQLNRLDRYEKRAASRSKCLLRELRRET